MVTDFGGDHAFGQVEQKLKEHYGITIPSSSARLVTLSHAHQIAEREDNLLQSPMREQTLLVVETDGSMIPIVRTRPKPDTENRYDARKHKEHLWKEARLTFARPLASITPIFAVTLKGVDVVGGQMMSCAKQAGFTERTKVHSVGDGAPWIANQVEEQFGDQATYLVDLYHVCEYLAEAAPKCSNNNREWLSSQKDKLKKGFLPEVLSTLKANLEPPETQDNEAPVRRCYRYLENRRHQLDYPTALEKGLPIGSGEVESAHRYVVQKRLKITGAWWKEENAADMLALRANRANQNWENYWQSRKIAA